MTHCLCFQNLTFFDVDMPWPSFLLDITRWFKLILDFDFAAITAPECAVRFSSPGQTFFVRMAIATSGLPIFCLAIALLYLIFVSACTHAIPHQLYQSISDTLLVFQNSLIAVQSQRGFQAFGYLLLGLPQEIANSCVISWSMMFVMLTRTAAEAFHCRPLDRDGAPWRKYPPHNCDFRGCH